MTHIDTICCKFGFGREWKRLIPWGGVILCLLMVMGGTVGAQDPPLRFGTIIEDPADVERLQQQLGAGFSPDARDPIIMLPLSDERLVVWYIHSSDGYVYLSLFDHDREQVVQKGEDFWGPYNIAPVLATGFLDANAMADLLISYTVNCGIGRTAECWGQDMQIIFDAHTVASPSISLSGVDRQSGACDQPEDCFFNRRVSLVMLLPAWGLRLKPSAFQDFQDAGMPADVLDSLRPLESQVFADETTFLKAVEALIGREDTETYHSLLIASLEPAPGSLYIWSWVEAEEGVVSWIEEDEYDGSYEIEHYDLYEQHVLLVATDGGTYQETSARLRMIFQERRARQAAPAPLLLDFWKDAQDYLCQEDEWFQKFQRYEVPPGYVVPEDEGLQEQNVP